MKAGEAWGLGKWTKKPGNTGGGEVKTGGRISAETVNNSTMNDLINHCALIKSNLVNRKYSIRI